MAIRLKDEQVDNKLSKRSINPFRILKERREEQIEQLKHFSGNGSGPDTSILELLAYKNITKDADHFVVLTEEADGYVELLSIRGQGVFSLSAGEQERIINGYHIFLQRMLDDIKIIISPFPADTLKQQRYWSEQWQHVNKKIAKEIDTRRRQQLLTRRRYIEIKQKQNLDVNHKLVSKEYILLLFGKTKQNLRDLRELAISWGGQSLNLEPLTLAKKEELLRRINNLNTQNN